MDFLLKIGNDKNKINKKMPPHTTTDSQPTFTDTLSQQPIPSKTQSALYQIFERNRLEMTIKDINLDFVDQVEVKTSEQTAKLEYTAGVSVIVKLVYEIGRAHV